MSISSALTSFEPHRPRLLRIAHRMLGTLSDAEDLVQDAYLRWHESDRESVRTEEAFLVTMVTRLSLDRLRRLKTERESYFGTWLPEPWLGGVSSEPAEPRADLSYAALVLLERLSPDERAAFLLREIFELDYPQIADCLQKGEPACRKLVQRAKEHLAGEPEGAAARRTVSQEEQRSLLAQLVAASRAQDAGQLELLLSPSVHLLSDGGGKVFAARYALAGAARIARTLWRFVNKGGTDLQERVVELDGEPAILTYVHGALFAVTLASIEDGRIQSLFKLLNPDKLRLTAERFPWLAD